MSRAEEEGHKLKSRDEHIKRALQWKWEDFLEFVPIWLWRMKVPRPRSRKCLEGMLVIL
jgi:hypothetical protein